MGVLGKGTIEVRGETIPYDVTTDGYFRVESPKLGWISCPTLDGLRTQIEKVLAAKKIRISVRYFDAGNHYTVVGRHAGTKKWLVREDGEKQPAQMGYLGNRLRPITDEEHQERKQLLETLSKAQDALRKWEDSRRMNVGRAAEEAWTKAERPRGGREPW